MTDQVILLTEKSSGSSIFQREITKHSNISTVAWTPHSEAETLYWVKAANMLGYPDTAFWASCPPFPKRFSRRSLEKIVQKNTGKLPDTDDTWSFLVQGWGSLVSAFGPVFFEKSPHHLNQWPALSCLNRYVKSSTADVKFIGLVRNPLSVIYSTHTRWHSQAYERQFMWEQSYRNLLAMKQIYSSCQLMIVRYEDLIADPRNEFEKVLSFIGLDFEDAIGKDLHARSLNKWDQDDSFSFKVHPAVMELGKQFGYSEQEMTCLKDGVRDRPPGPGRVGRILIDLRKKVNFYRQHVLK